MLHTNTNASEKKMSQATAQIIDFHAADGLLPAPYSAFNTKLAEKKQVRTFIEAAHELAILDNPLIVRTLAADLAAMTQLTPNMEQVCFRTAPGGRHRMIFRAVMCGGQYRVSVLVNQETGRDKIQQGSYVTDGLEHFGFDIFPAEDAEQLIRAFLHMADQPNFKITGGKHDHRSTTLFLRYQEPKQSDDMLTIYEVSLTLVRADTGEKLVV